MISIRTEKTGCGDPTPILPGLQATLEAGPTGDLAFIANTGSGNPLTKEILGNLLADACKVAGVGKSAHGPRKAGATNAANHGVTVAELEASARAKNLAISKSVFEVVRSEGLEPPRFYSLPPQGSASTNSATSA